MFKRILSLLLCLLMFGACLVGCSKEKDAVEETAKEASKSTATIAMHLMSEKEVSEKQAAEIQNAVNKITKSKFKTQLVLHFYTEEDYYLALDQAYADRKNAGADKQNSSNAAKDEAAAETVEETFVDEYGVTQLKYPTIPDYQVDIFYLGGYEKLMEYIDANRLSDLSAELSSASKKIKTFMTPGYLESINKVCDGTFAIPANEPVGEYTYMLINRDLMKKYHHVASDFDSLIGTTTAQFLQAVKDNETDYVPLRSFTETKELDITNFGYFGIDENGNFDGSTFSLLGGNYDSSWKYGVAGQYIPCQNIFLDSSSFKSDVSTLIGYKEAGYYGTEADADKDFAVGYIKGGIELVDEYSDKYEVIVLENPQLNTMDLFNHMFAVSSYTTNLARSMEILTYLYTNADFRNLLLYGIEGTNYELVESEMKDANGDPYMVVKRLNENYMMAPEKTGNTLLAIPTVDQAPNLRDLYKQQNGDSSVSLVMGFKSNFNGLYLSEEHSKVLRDESKKFYDKIGACKTVAEFDAEVGALAPLTTIEGTKLYEAMGIIKIPNPVDPSLAPYETLRTLYGEWLAANKLVSSSD